MADPPETIEDSNGRVSLSRNTQFQLSPKESLVGDHMLAEYTNGVVEDVAIVQEAGQPRAKLLVPNLTTGRGFFAFQDVDAATETRLLALHKMFGPKAA